VVKTARNETREMIMNLSSFCEPWTIVGRFLDAHHKSEIPTVDTVLFIFTEHIQGDRLARQSFDSPDLAAVGSSLPLF
jgi:hypothetical protein